MSISSSAQPPAKESAVSALRKEHGESRGKTVQDSATESGQTQSKQLRSTKKASSGSPAQHTEPSGSAGKYLIQVATTPEEALGHLGPWEILVGQCLEPNVFQEPWMLLKGWKWFAGSTEIKCVFIYQKPERASDVPVLAGVFPTVQRRLFRGGPRVVGLWRHQYNFLATPLLHPDHATAALEALVTWAAAQRPTISLIELAHVHGDGPFHQAVIQLLHDRPLISTQVDRYNRAIMQRNEHAERYCQSAQTCHNRQEIRRKQRRLNEAGNVEFKVFLPGDDVDAWTAQFLALEASGWKGNTESALALDETAGAYFAEVCREAAARDQLMMLSLNLNHQPIAMKCNFVSGHGSYAFKIAFDESQSRFSPGVLLEIFNIEQMHARDGLQWMDSCAKAEHFMINRLWRERRTIQKLWISTGTLTGDLTCATLPLLRFLRKRASQLLPRERTSPS